MEWNKVKVFSATKAREREELGDVITRWIASEKPEVIDVQVRQSSDNEFHCLSLTFFYK
jgi:thiamine pyrophosphate-dependent acetolactate synthase large subunit-like protein